MTWTPERSRYLRRRNSVPTCRWCGVTVRWATTPNGRRMPLDAAATPDGQFWIDQAGVVHRALAVTRTARYQRHDCRPQ